MHRYNCTLCAHVTYQIIIENTVLRCIREAKNSICSQVSPENSAKSHDKLSIFREVGEELNPKTACLQVNIQLPLNNTKIRNIATETHVQFPSGSQQQSTAQGL